MSLRDVIDDVEGREKRLTLYDPPTESIRTELEEYFASQQVRIEVATTDSNRSGYAVLTAGDDGRVLAAVDLRRLRGLRVGRPDDGHPFAPIFEHLADTTFTSFDVGQLLAASREMEDRAWRHGVGELHAGFQNAGALRDQTEVYEGLATRDLDVHVYCAPEPSVPPLEGVTVHQEGTAEIRESWFVVYDGGGAPDSACALLAQERDPPDERRFYGVWTYDPGTVRSVLDHLTERYGSEPG
ncbi:hypothetical protein HUG10_08010 [Halorarum halophilum]|uniref:DICT domain-containing protein n=1 Tax=Halorarum halophilum TaxID=2743090 RepID=A0A7D5K7G6_9EURY|nr:DICT sensory domain-containing protein [Halobaculum halophilum]QLG27499.1 hypothetical protein HUG10_08010 [Halobaculum halophilum]